MFGESPGFSDGLNWALAGKGVIVMEKAFQNLTSSELQQKGATISESLSGLPLHVRGNLGGASAISKAQYSRLLRLVTTHLSSVSNIFVHDGAIGSSSKSDVKVRVISDSPSAVLTLSSILWKTPSRAVSHDSCPLTVYAATSISEAVGDAVGLGSQGITGYIAADVERSALILCGKAFADIDGTKKALAALSGPVLYARGGLPLSARLLVSGDSVALFFASENAIQSCNLILLSGISTSLPCIILEIPSRNHYHVNGDMDDIYVCPLKSSGTIPSVSKLSPGQAAYHFLASYQNGEFVPAYAKGPSCIDALDLAKALLSKLKEYQIPTFLVNISTGEMSLTGKDLLDMVGSPNVAPLKLKGKQCGFLQGKYNGFLSCNFREIPQEFSF
ncbi:Phosphoenolpyruvate carboxykinase, ATP-utilizing [Corchorus olitorius]|uniref:phosphoenolpyruvate carboxykinase (ATP) n=1 Tax=Corchorus olitorius TaxID=93759 RepID=A0A1R3JNX3_9ROSI|nr:Phosphoenolpyruvate carboxykinase, ATP-utilizing [Corchorus olitorius]